MNRLPSLAFRVAVAALVLSSIGVGRMYAQAPAQPPAQTPGPSAATPPPAAESAKPAEDENPFAVKPAPPLPTGMTGSDATDPRFKLTPGLYDAGGPATRQPGHTADKHDRLTGHGHRAAEHHSRTRARHPPSDRSAAEHHRRTRTRRPRPTAIRHLSREPRRAHRERRGTPQQSCTGAGSGDPAPGAGGQQPAPSRAPNSSPTRAWATTCPEHYGPRSWTRSKPWPRKPTRRHRSACPVRQQHLPRTRRHHPLGDPWSVFGKSSEITLGFPVPPHS